MKIEVKTRGTKEFYDEMLFVVTYCKKFIKNPKRKAYQYTHYLYLYIILSVTFCACFGFLYWLEQEWYSLVMIGAFLLTLMFELILLINVKKRIKMYMEDKSDKVIEITNEFICFSSDTMNLKMNKPDIGTIVINKYSTCILSKIINSYAISISNDYLDEFIKGAKENGFDNIIVDNRK